MPRATADRPSRRLEAILGTLRRHGVRTFRAANLPGIGDGIQVDFAEQPEAPIDAPAQVERPVHPEANGVQRPRDELELVAEGRDGPVQ